MLRFRAGLKVRSSIEHTGGARKGRLRPEYGRCNGVKAIQVGYVASTRWYIQLRLLDLEGFAQAYTSKPKSEVMLSLAVSETLL